MSANMLTRPQQILFALLKLALWNKVPDQALFENSDEALWNNVYHLSSIHGLGAIALDGIRLLPKELQPPRSVKLRWMIHVNSTESKYEQTLTVANEIAGLLAENNIQILIFKGLGLAQFYPVPAHRSFGDIDCYLFGKQEEGDRILVKAGAVEDHNTEKHNALLYKGILIENHRYFLTEDNRYYNLPVLEDQLMKTIANGNFLNNPLVNKALFPPPGFDILFILCHTYGHYIMDGLFLRHLCDWAVFLKANKGKIDFEAYRQIIARSNLTKFSDAFTALTVKYLDLEPELAPPYGSDPEYENRILQESFDPSIRDNFNRLSFLQIVKLKINRLKSRKWKYEEATGMNYYKAIIHSIYFHIVHPKSITR